MSETEITTTQPPINRDAVFYASLLAESMVPGGLHDGLVSYLVYGVPPGSFLRFVLENDLLHAAMKADDINAPLLVPIVRWLMNVAPHGSFGSPENVAEWMTARQVERRRAS